MPFLDGLVHIKADLAAFFFQHVAAEAYGVSAFLGAQIVLNAAARPGGLDYLEPVTVGITAGVCDDFNNIAVFQFRAQGHEAAVDLCARTVLPDLGVDDKGKIQRRRAFRQFLYIACRGVDIDLVLEEIHFERMHELARVGFFALPFKNFP